MFVPLVDAASVSPARKPLTIDTDPEARVVLSGSLTVVPDDNVVAVAASGISGRCRHVAEHRRQSATVVEHHIDPEIVGGVRGGVDWGKCCWRYRHIPH